MRLDRGGVLSLTVLGVLVGVFAIWALAGMAQMNEICAGDVVDTVLCEGAQLRQSIFGGLVVLAVITASSVIAAAFLLRDRLTAPAE